MMRQDFAQNQPGNHQLDPLGMGEHRAGNCFSAHRPRIVFTADDFGRSHEINRAVIRAHREGLLTAASLIITGEAADEAINIAAEMPTLAVGLHLVVANGRSVLGASQIPHLVNDQGEFRNDPRRAGIYYGLSRQARRELARELRAQFEKFTESGLPLSHVDGHMHMHVHPAVLEIVLPLAEKFGATGIRVPCEPLREAIGSPTYGRPAKFFRSFVVGALGRRCRRLLHRRGSKLATVDRVIGLSESGHMTEAYVICALERISDGATEFVCHPTEGDRLDELGPNPGDLQTLLSQRVAKTLNELGLQKATYGTISADTIDGVEAT